MGGTLNVNGGTVSGPQGEQVVVNGGLVNAGAGMWVVDAPTPTPVEQAMPPEHCQQ